MRKASLGMREEIWGTGWIECRVEVPKGDKHTCEGPEDGRIRCFWCHERGQSSWNIVSVWERKGEVEAMDADKLFQIINYSKKFGFYVWACRKALQFYMMQIINIFLFMLFMISDQKYARNTPPPKKKSNHRTMVMTLVMKMGVYTHFHNVKPFIILNFNINVTMHEFTNIKVYWGILLLNALLIAWTQLTGEKHLNTFWGNTCIFLIFLEKKLLENVHETEFLWRKQLCKCSVTGRSWQHSNFLLKS